jgi:hypothetical protein
LCLYMKEGAALHAQPEGRGRGAAILMSYAKLLLDIKPVSSPVDVGLRAVAIDALNDCAQACIADTDADLGEHDVAEMVTCIRLCLDCADICVAAAGITSRPSMHDPDVVRPLLEACVASCQSCGDECERHASMHEHCRICAEACRELLNAMK